MRKHFALFASAALFTLTTTAFSQVNMILDTDFGGDADDLGALAMVHNFIDRGECNLLAVMCWSTEQHAVPGIDAVNRYYKHPDIPIGVRKASTFSESWHHGKSIADNLPHTLTYSDAPDATMLYRQLLAKCDDKSVVIVTIGPLMNIQNLIESGPDSSSPLTGKALIEKKVKEFVIMGGQFPMGENEWNFDGRMPGVTQFVVQNIPVPITFSGYETGLAIKTGEVFNGIDTHSPLYIGNMHFSQNAPWMKAHFKGAILDNSTYDQTAVLYAVRNGLGIYWDKVSGYCVPDEKGGNKWINDSKGSHSYLRLKTKPEEMATLIESIMLNNF